VLGLLFLHHMFGGVVDGAGVFVAEDAIKVESGLPVLMGLSFELGDALVVELLVGVVLPELVLALLL